jgi:hypothetical protein
MMGNNGELHVVELGAHDERLMLNEYKGKVAIIICREGTDGRNYFRMAYPKTKNGHGETAIPLGVNLGAPKQAIAILEQFLAVLKPSAGKGAGKRPEPPRGREPGDDDIPY